MHAPLNGDTQSAGRRQSRENPFEETRGRRLAKRALLLFILVHIPLGAMSSYRAWVQIHDLSISVSAPVVTAGGWVRADLGSWGRKYVDYGIELVQGVRDDTLGYHIVPQHRNPTYNNSIKRDSLIITFTDSMLAPFADGPALLRATAVGGPQWMRTPPPVVRELAVIVRRRR
jgi:hypothetical protein